MLGDIFAGSGGISTIGLASSAQSYQEVAAAQAGQTPVAQPGAGTSLLSVRGIGIGALLLLAIAYVLDRSVL
jgi:hypothetical protein